MAVLQSQKKASGTAVSNYKADAEEISGVSAGYVATNATDEAKEQEIIKSMVGGMESQGHRKLAVINGGRV